MLIADEQNVREALKKNNSNTLQSEKVTLKVLQCVLGDDLNNYL